MLLLYSSNLYTVNPDHSPIGLKKTLVQSQAGGLNYTNLFCYILLIFCYKKLFFFSDCNFPSLLKMSWQTYVDDHLIATTVSNYKDDLSPSPSL